MTSVFVQVKNTSNNKLDCILCKDEDQEAGRLVDVLWIMKARSLVYTHCRPKLAKPVEWGPYPRRECGFAVKGRTFVFEDEVYEELLLMDPLDTWRSFMPKNSRDETVIQGGANQVWEDYKKGVYIKYNPFYKFDKKDDRYVHTFFFLCRKFVVMGEYK